MASSTSRPLFILTGNFLKGGAPLQSPRAFPQGDGAPVLRPLSKSLFDGKPLYEADFGGRSSGHRSTSAPRKTGTAKTGQDRKTGKIPKKVMVHRADGGLFSQTVWTNPVPPATPVKPSAIEPDTSSLKAPSTASNAPIFGQKPLVSPVKMPTKKLDATQGSQLGMFDVHPLPSTPKPAPIAATRFSAPPLAAQPKATTSPKPVSAPKPSAAPTPLSLFDAAERDMITPQLSEAKGTQNERQESKSKESAHAERQTSAGTTPHPNNRNTVEVDAVGGVAARPVRDGDSGQRAGAQSPSRAGTAQRGRTGAKSGGTGSKRASNVRDAGSRPAGGETQPRGEHAPVAGGLSGLEDQSVEARTEAKIEAPAEDVEAAPETAVEENVAVENDFQPTGLQGSFDPSANAGEFRITPEMGIGEGGLKQKADDNFAAVDLLKALDEEKRSPTADEKVVLAKYTGWGAFGQVFQKKFNSWLDMPGELPYYATSNWTPADKKHFELARELHKRLSPEEWAGAGKSTLNAHYTDPKVVSAVWNAVERMGFEGGRVLEPAVGTGNFLGLQPEDSLRRSTRTAVELDPLTARICHHLYPHTNVIQAGFQDAPLADDGFDLVISNVPFGDYGVTDKEYIAQNKTHLTKSIHNYFFAKGLDKVRPGGVVAFITSHHTMDSSSNQRLRDHLSEQAHFLGAVRLPNNAFEGNAGTKVTTDIIFLQKKDPAFEALHPRGADGRFQKKWGAVVKQVADDGTEYELNEYFAEHPRMMVGKMKRGGGLYNADNMGCVYDNEPEYFERDLGTRLKQLPMSIMVPASYDQRKPDQLAKAEGLKPLSFTVVQDADGNPALTEDGQPQIAVAYKGKLYPLSLLEKRIEELKETKVPRWDADTLFLTRHMADFKTVPDAGHRIAGMIALRDMVNRLNRRMGEGCGDSELQRLQSDLNSAYDAFKKKFGLLHSITNKRLIATDPEDGLVLALEDGEEFITPNPKNKTGVSKTVVYSKAAIFSSRTVPATTVTLQASSPTDALAICQNEVGHLDFRRMSELLRQDATEVRDALLASGHIYRDFAKSEAGSDGGYTTSDEFLSGNVREKLRQNRELLEALDGRIAEQGKAVPGATLESWQRERALLQRNVDNLERVQPEDLTPGQIIAPLGATWVPPTVINGFINHLAGKKVTGLEGSGAYVSYLKGLNRWNVETRAYLERVVQETWATGRMPLLELLECALNMKEPTVYDTDSSGNRILNSEQTEAAKAKLQKLNDEFEGWWRQDYERADQMCALYNKTFNAVRLREFDGSHLTLEGMSEECRHNRFSHIKDAVWRAVQTGRALFDHVVGAGKTSTLSATAMELRRLGLARKPMLAVPNHMIGQWEREFRQLYPQAKLLVVSSSGLSDNRRTLTAKIAMGDYDAVLITHKAFELIPCSPEMYEKYLKDAEDEVEAAQALAEAEGADPKTGKEMQKKLENLKVKLQNQIERAKIAKDNGMTFDQLGVDALLVDEFHEFKNLPFTTKLTRLAGINNDGAARSTDMFIKSQHLLAKNGNRGFYTATGTPIANSTAEMWTMQRYVMLDDLRRMGLDLFDAWASTFGKIETATEVTVAGTYKAKTRFNQFVNVPEMARIYRSVTDVRTKDDLKLPTPEVENHFHLSEPSRDQDWFMGTIRKRSENMPTDPSKDNFLKLTGDARKASLDMRMVDSRYGEDRQGKLAQVASQIISNYHDSHDYRGTQCVFLDMGTPKAPSNVSDKKPSNDEEGAPEGDEVSEAEATWQNQAYGAIRQKLIASGIPAEEIAFAHDFKTDIQRGKINELMNSGKLRVLIGSSGKMGAGLNMQKRLYALHHVDCPWRPCDLEQREGRIVRQGNLHQKGIAALRSQFTGEDYELLDADHPDRQPIPVKIHRYGTKGTLDEKMWQTIRQKAGFIATTKKGGNGDRIADEVDSLQLTAGDIQAGLARHPLERERIDNMTAVKRLNGLRRAHEDEKFTSRRKLSQHPHAIATFRQQADRFSVQAAALDRHAEAWDKGKLPTFAMQVDGTDYLNGKSREDAGKALHFAHARWRKSRTKTGETLPIGRYGPFILELESGVSHDGIPDQFQVALRAQDGTRLGAVTEGKTHAATTLKIDNLLRGLRESAEDMRDEAKQKRDYAANLEGALPALQAKVDAPFEHSEELARLAKRQEEIQSELAKITVEESADDYEPAHVRRDRLAAEAAEAARQVAQQARLMGKEVEVAKAVKDVENVEASPRPLLRPSVPPSVIVDGELVRLRSIRF